MSNQIVPFEFGSHEVRVVDVGGEPWFIAGDVSRVLGYRDAFNMVRRLDMEDKGTQSVSTPGGAQEMAIISEPGLYAAILGSQVDGAREFKRWVTHTVIPEIRRTGSYVKPLTLAEKSLALLTELTGEVQRQAAEIAVLEPKADAWDGLASGNGTYSVGDAAKMLCQVGIDTGRDRLFEFLHGLGWVYRGAGRWQARQTAVGANRLLHKPQSHEHPETGERVLDAPQVRVTMKGLSELRTLMQAPIKHLTAVA